MSKKENSNRRGLSSPVVVFFIFAVLCVAAFLIVMLVKSCEADHAVDELEKANEQIQEQIENNTQNQVYVPGTYQIEVMA